MSIESANAFLERIKTDEDFKKKVGWKKTAEERMKFVKSQGFDFTKEDIVSVRVQLTNDELVVGGDLVFMGTCCRAIGEQHR